MPFGLQNPFSRKKDASDPLLEAYTDRYIGSVSSPSAAEAEQRHDLEINIHTIEDEGILKELENLAYDVARVPEVVAVPDVDPSTGKVLGVQYKTAYKDQRYIRRPWALAVRNAVSKVLPTRFVKPYDAVTYKIKVRNEFKKIWRSMPIGERETFGNYLDTLLIYAETGIDDSVDGQKMYALKVRQNKLEVGLNRVPKGK
jgi:hypothetical protein